MISGERLNAIRAVVLAQQYGSFSRAGEHLGLSPSAVGKAISRLEDRLGVRLFHRTTRSLSLTDEGRSYYESCTRALNELEAAELALTRGKAEPSGKLRVSLPDLFGRKVLAPALLDLARTFPSLQLDLSFENRIIDLAEEGMDLVVRIGEPPETSGLIARSIGFQDLVLCASPAYMDNAPPLSVANDLVGHSLLSQARGGSYAPWLIADERGVAGRLHAVGVHRFNALDTIADAALAGMGIAQLPEWLVSDAIVQGRLIHVLPNIARPRLPIFALWLQRRGMPARVRAAIDTLRKAASSQPILQS